MGNSVNQNDAEQGVDKDQQEKLHETRRLVQRIGPVISPEVYQFYHRWLFIHEGCIHGYLRSRALINHSRRDGINSIAGMKLRERIEYPDSSAVYYKNTAFLRGMLPYLDGIFFWSMDIPKL